jgi:hypothetical protein
MTIASIILKDFASLWPIFDGAIKYGRNMEFSFLGEPTRVQRGL